MKRNNDKTIQHPPPRETHSPDVVRKCADCGETVIGERKTYHYRECGLSNIKLEGILVFECRCGAISPEIPAINALHLCLAMAILRKETLLSGEEIRFLRKMAGLTQAELAELLGVDKTRPSKWESSDAGEKIGRSSDRLFRAVALYGIIQQESADSDNPVDAIRAAETLVRSLDVLEIFRKLQDSRSEKPQVQTFGHDPKAVALDRQWRKEQPDGSMAAAC